MPDVMIDKFVFDFLCSTESAARTVSDEMLHYKASAINGILSDVFSAEMEPDAFWKIDRLEIDLGSIRLEDFPGEAVLRQFRERLQTNIAASRPSEFRQAGPGAGSVARGTDQMEILSQLLLSGDLPWWVDKTRFSGVDELVAAVIRLRPAELKLFLDRNHRNPHLAVRINALCSPGSVSKLNQLFPGVADFANRPFFDSPEEWKEEMKALPLHVWRTGNDSLKTFLIARLMADPGRLMAALELGGFLSGSGFTRLGVYMADKSREQRTKAVKMLEKLSLFQLAFLESSFGFRGSGAETATGKGTGNRQKLVSRISSIVGGDAKLESRLIQISLAELQKLETTLKRYATDQHQRRRWIEMLAEDPALFQQKILSILPLSPEDLNDRGNNRTLLQLRALQANLRRVVGKMSVPDWLLLHETFRPANPDGAAQQRLIQRLLDRLPVKSIGVISALMVSHPGKIKEPANLLPEPPKTDRIIIENAGLCLLAPYLPSFFQRLGYVQQGRFASRAKACRAVYLLEFLVNGRQKNFEYTMQINKLLCGLEIRDPLPKYRQLTSTEKQESDSLLSSVIGNWKGLGSTGTKGFRSSFLQRKGILQQQDNLWTLRVERKAFDLLLDSIPWSFNRIKFSWMEKMIETSW